MPFFLSAILNIVSLRPTLRPNWQEKVVKPSYSLVADLHGMQGVRGSNPLGSTYFFIDISGFKGSFRKDITFVPTFPSLFSQF